MDQLAQAILRFLAGLGWLGRAIFGMLWRIGQHSTQPAAPPKRAYPDPIKLVGCAIVTIVLLVTSWFLPLPIPTTVSFLMGFGCGGYMIHVLYRRD